jgi:hypothetical protein
LNYYPETYFKLKSEEFLRMGLESSIEVQTINGRGFTPKFGAKTPQNN